MRTLAADVAIDAGNQLGEGALWDPRTGELVWLDTPAGLVQWYSPDDGSVRSLEVPAPVSTICLREDGGYVLTHGRRVGLLDDGATAILDAESRCGVSHILNDGAVDERGRLWAGTARRRLLPAPAHDATDDVPDLGGLFRIGADLELDPVRRDVTTCNGIDWSPDGRTMYAVVEGVITVAAFDADAGSAHPHSHLPIPDEHGEPDGLVVDAQGDLWVAFYGTSAVRQYAPTGECLTEVPLPVEKVTSCAFGGAAQDTLYITTGRWGLPQESLSAFPHAGAVFALRPDVRGRVTHGFSG
jgi:sugar lactone lactonase YvrE